MYEQENQRATHLLILSVYTILTIMLSAESLLLGWDKGAVILLLLGVLASWGSHITEKVPESLRLWMYFVLTMLAFFFYGSHETSIYDMAPLMIVLIIMYSATENHMIIRLCVATYFVTMLYDLLLVQGASMELDSLMITRTALHLILVYMAGRLARIVINRRSRERKNTDKKISQLEEANRRTEDFLTNVSHELRTPINVVTGITSVMLKNEDNETKRRDIYSVQKAGHRLFDQIEDILDYTEIDTGRIKVSEENYMMSSIVNDIITGIRQSEREKIPELILDIDAGMPSVLLGDGRKIKKILKHLIDNSIKYTPKGAVYMRIYAIKKSYGVNLCMSISDTGVGIKKEELEKITERFYQSDRGRRQRSGGLGLGLSIVHGMVNVMEGFMQIESTVGEGTTVSVSIPQKVTDAATGIVVQNKEKLCIACYLRPEKYEIPEVRDYYNRMIANMVCQLDISLHRVSDMDELRKLNSMYQLTHIFIGKEEYEDNSAYFEQLSQSMEVILVADDGFVMPKDNRIKLIRKPLYCLSVANVLNAGASNGELENKHIVCPGVKVLVVDDEPMNLMVAEGILGGYGMKVKTVGSGREAIDICDKEAFDLIFLDHMMPEMDGVETLKQLRRRHANSDKELIVIAFTANAVSSAREMFFREGFDEFISKPVERTELERVLKKLLPKSQIKFSENDYKYSPAADDDDERTPEYDNALPEAAAETAIRETDIPESDEQKDKVEQLEDADINTASGIRYCGGDREFYINLIITFSGDASQKRMKIDNFFKQQDWDNYCTLVHALKSSSKMLGADSLSERARKLEFAAKERDVDYINEHHDELLEQYDELIKRINAVFDIAVAEEQQNMETEIKEISAEELIGILTEIKADIDSFETDRADEIIQGLSSDIYKGASLSELFSDIRKDLEDFELESASGRIEALLKAMEGGEA